MSRCDKCVTDKSNCVSCRENPIYANVPTASQFTAYIPVCPRGYKDCVCDPAYIKYSDPDWYKSLFGTMTPKEAIFKEGGCFERFQDDPNEEFYCYDDEDK